MILSDYREDVQKHSAGAPFYIGDGCFYIRRWGTAESQKAIKEIRLAIFGPLHKTTEGDDEILIAHWLVEHGVAKWEGVMLEEGKPLKYSKDAARKVFLNPEYFRSVNHTLWVGSQTWEHYLHDEAEKDLASAKKP
jgi:hypothetical protein